MLIGYCQKCGKAGLRNTADDGVWNVDAQRAGFRWCPRCEKWVIPGYKSEQQRREERERGGNE